MYLHCVLSFPYVEISFEKEEKFNSEKMIDFINRGQNRKVNFVVLPSLFSNGNFLQNGKSWVFTYNKNTFKFEESELEELNKKITKKDIQIPNLIKDLKLSINLENRDNDIYVIAKTNFEISEKLKPKYCFHLMDKDNNITKETVFFNFLKIPNNYKIHKCNMFIGDKCISSNIIN